MTVGFGIMEFISDLNESNYQKIIEQKLKLNILGNECGLWQSRESDYKQF